MNGWIKIHRKLKLWEWYSDHNTTRLFIHLLLSVNRDVGSHQGMEIPIGCVKTGRKELAKQTGLSEQQIRRSLNNLQTSRDITIKPTNKFSLITVVKWGEYQSAPEKATSKRANKQPTNAPINNHKQEVENKEEENKESFDRVWALYLRKGNKQKSKEYWSKLKPEDRDAIEAKIPAYIESKPEEQYRSDFQGWINPKNRKWEDKIIDRTTNGTSPAQQTEYKGPTV